MTRYFDILSSPNNPLFRKSLLFLFPAGNFDLNLEEEEEVESYLGTARFFINPWIWGYEDILKAIVRHLGCRIHLDSYKFDVFRRLKNDPFLSNLGTRDENATRFHSCERFGQCSQIALDDEGDEEQDFGLSEESQDLGQLHLYELARPLIKPYHDHDTPLFLNSKRSYPYSDRTQCSFTIPVIPSGLFRIAPICPLQLCVPIGFAPHPGWVWVNEDFDYEPLDEGVKNRVHWFGDDTTMADEIPGSDNAWYLDPEVIDIPPW
ncbi:hypothetical protein D9758_009662 [Tetrapyrgos nigripes]|uniref:Uncharacterized protein n=1 Tax=Tetrapyrgos nigripes TaxID=182062 RepID=A0A8H5CPC8_9AGAR|nr:hypothetical protein D9758_009662 [Tetrapyrgos nigripes]